MKKWSKDKNSSNSNPRMALSNRTPMTPLNNQAMNLMSNSKNKKLNKARNHPIPRELT